VAIATLSDNVPTYRALQLGEAENPAVMALYGIIRRRQDSNFNNNFAINSSFAASRGPLLLDFQFP